MSMEDLEIEAMMLPPDERERLAERLLWSLGCDLVYEREQSAWPTASADGDGGPPCERARTGGATEGKVSFEG